MDKNEEQKDLNNNENEDNDFEDDGEDYNDSDYEQENVDYGNEDYEDLFDWINTDSLDEKVKVTNYVYSVSLKYDDSYNYEPKIYNTNREVRCCPVCGGNGIVSNGFYNHTGNTWVTSTTASEQCRSCNGKGYVEI